MKKIYLWISKAKGVPKGHMVKKKKTFPNAILWNDWLVYSEAYGYTGIIPDSLYHFNIVKQIWIEQKIL